MSGPNATRMLAASVLLLGGCAHLPASRGVGCDVEPIRKAAIVEDGSSASTTLNVLTYNVEGLAWPARSGRKHMLRMIGDALRHMRDDPRGPDVVLVQEAFSRAAAKGVEAADYPSLVNGPSRTMRSLFERKGKLPGKAKPLKGEIGLRFLSSGLMVLSRYPIVEAAAQPYSRRSCAGIDCLSNKGVVMARIAVPGVPAPVALFNTHMNSQNASRVAPRRHLAAHNRQTEELRTFVLDHWQGRSPAILGGDFNMRDAPGRFEPFGGLYPLELVHQRCLEEPQDCDVRMSWDDDEPWMDTQDLQLFASGSDVAIRPVMVEALFDGRPGSPKLSDHDGLHVTYELTWNRATSPTDPCPRR